MKEHVISGVSARCEQQELVSEDPAVTAGDSVVPLSNLELLGDVAFAMSRPDSVNDSVAPSLTDGVVLGAADGPVSAGSVFYIVPSADSDAPQNDEGALLQAYECLTAAGGDSSADNAPAVYFAPLPDGYDDPSCNVAAIQYSHAEQCGDNLLSNCVESESTGYESVIASGDVVSVAQNVVSTADSGFVPAVDMSFESFTLTVLTNFTS